MATESRKRRPGRPKNPVPRETLIALALRAFAERGYAGASMAEIAGSAGLRKASLFHHFATKEALYLEVLQSIITELGALVSEARLLRGPFIERLDRLGTLGTGYFGTHPGAARLLLRELLDSGPFYEGVGSLAVRSTLDGIAAFLQAGMLEGEIPYQDPHQLALSIASIHLTYYSVPQVSGELLEADIHDPEINDARLEAVLEQIRRLCGAAPSA
jgi:TetR/AcrR family transcriptional regulator